MPQSISSGNNPSANPTPNKDNQSPAINSSTVPGSSSTGSTQLANNPSAPTDPRANVNPVANANAVATQNVTNANATSSDDYRLRADQLNTNNNRQKVALVGRTGAGARALTANIGTNEASTLTNALSVVVFEATPDMTEQGGTILVDIGDIRAAASIVIYMGSPSRNFTINAKFISRTKEQATENMKYINILKAWREPTIKSGGSIGGAEPETLRLFAYGDVLKGIPCMINNLSIEYSSEVDYIKTTLEGSTSSSVWVPIIQNVSIGLKEVRSWNDLKTFDYESFKRGQLEQW